MTNSITTCTQKWNPTKVKIRWQLLKNIIVQKILRWFFVRKIFMLNDSCGVIVGSLKVIIHQKFFLLLFQNLNLKIQRAKSTYGHSQRRDQPVSNWWRSPKRPYGMTLGETRASPPQWTGGWRRRWWSPGQWPGSFRPRNYISMCPGLDWEPGWLQTWQKSRGGGGGAGERGKNLGRNGSMILDDKFTSSEYSETFWADIWNITKILQWWITPSQNIGMAYIFTWKKRRRSQVLATCTSLYSPWKVSQCY